MTRTLIRTIDIGGGRRVVVHVKKRDAIPFAKLGELGPAELKSYKEGKLAKQKGLTLKDNPYTGMQSSAWKMGFEIGATRDCDCQTTGRDASTKDMNTGEPEEGEKVLITYGKYNGRVGKVIELSPSGMFAVVQVDGNRINIDVSDLKKI